MHKGHVEPSNWNRVCPSFPSNKSVSNIWSSSALHLHHSLHYTTFNSNGQHPPKRVSHPHHSRPFLCLECLFPISSTSDIKVGSNRTSLPSLPSIRTLLTFPWQHSARCAQVILSGCCSLISRALQALVLPDLLPGDIPPPTMGSVTLFFPHLPSASVDSWKKIACRVKGGPRSSCPTWQEKTVSVADESGSRMLLKPYDWGV